MENQLENDYSQKLQNILNNYEIEGNLPENAHIEIYLEENLVTSTKKGEEFSNLNMSAIAKLEVAQRLSKDTPVNGLENLTIQAVHDDKVDTLFNTDKNGMIETNIAKPPQPAIERIQDLLNSKKLKAQGLEQLTNIVAELAQQIKLQNDFVKEQTAINRNQEDINIEQEAWNNATADIVTNHSKAFAEQAHNQKSKEIAKFFINIAKSQPQNKFTKEGEQYTVSANGAKGDLRIWRKESDKLIYSQKENQVELNLMSENDVDNFLATKQYNEKINAEAQAQATKIEKPITQEVKTIGGR